MAQVKHKNSQEVFNLKEPLYYKWFRYGYLVVMNNRVFFITSFNDELEFEDITDEFEFI
jgi:hypothetical protein